MAQAADITGAGATFIYPILSKWSDTYNNKTGNKINYQSIGSGGGIAQIKAGTVDFGSSDKPLDPKELDEAHLAQFPSVIGGVVPVANIEGLTPGKLRFTGPLLADIYLGNIKKWNDPKIAAVNAGVKLPDLAIQAVYRSDGSGTTFNWVNYLSKVSPEWKEKIGEGTSVQWPVGVGGKGNEGVAAYVNQIKGSIGYVELAYALQNKMAFASVQNSAGEFVQPSAETFQAAAAGADWANAKGFYLVLTNEPGAESWPISGASFILIYKKPDSPPAVLTALHFFDWAYKKGDQMAEDLAYVPVPDAVVDLVRKQWSEIVDTSGKAIW